MTPKRNPERVLRALAAYLRENPDMRVGQAVANHLPVAAGNDPFYVEDDDLATLLECSTPPSAPSPRDEGRAREALGPWRPLPTREEALAALGHVCAGEVRRCIPVRPDDDDVVIDLIVHDWLRLLSLSPSLGTAPNSSNEEK
jgi:hypothetical protein